jgi:hypothetical protein
LKKPENSQKKKLTLGRNANQQCQHLRMDLLPRISGCKSPARHDPVAGQSYGYNSD